MFFSKKSRQNSSRQKLMPQLKQTFNQSMNANEFMISGSQMQTPILNPVQSVPNIRKKNLLFQQKNSQQRNQLQSLNHKIQYNTTKFLYQSNERSTSQPKLLTSKTEQPSQQQTSILQKTQKQSSQMLKRPQKLAPLNNNSNINNNPPKFQGNLSMQKSKSVSGMKIKFPTVNRPQQKPIKPIEPIEKQEKQEKIERIPSPPNLQLKQKLIKQKYEYKDCIKEMMKITQELQIILEFEEEKSEELQKIFDTVLKQRDYVRKLMIKYHTKEDFIKQTHDFYESVIELNENQQFMDKFKFHYQRYLPLIENAQVLKHIHLAEKLEQEQKKQEQRKKIAELEQQENQVQQSEEMVVSPVIY